MDVLGSVLLALGLGTLTFALVKGNDYDWASRMIVATILISLVSLLGFVLMERKTKCPMIDVTLFRSKQYSASIVLIGVIFFAYMPISYLMNFYLENALQYSVLHSGLLLGIVSAVSFVTSPLFSLVSHKTSPRVISFFAVLFVTAGNLLFVLLDGNHPLPIILTAFILLGLGVGATTPLYQSAYEEIEPDKNGMASGLQNSLRQLTACIAIALVATMSGHFSTVAVDNTKQQVLSEVQSSSVLVQQEKDMITTAINQSQGSSVSKDSAEALLQQQMSVVLSDTPQEQQAIVAEKLSVQKQAVEQILDDSVSIGHQQRDAVYHKCFLVTGCLLSDFWLCLLINGRRKQNKIDIDATRTMV